MRQRGARKCPDAGKYGWFNTRAAAESKARNLKKDGVIRWAYRCKTGTHWHLTSHEPWPKK